MSKTKVWIIGAQGRLGSTISDALDRMAYNVLTSDMDVDITDMDSVTAFMDMSHPAVVINCAGYNTHNWLEEDMVKAFRVNAIGARNVASAYRVGGWYILCCRTGLFKTHADAGCAACILLPDLR